MTSARFPASAVTAGKLSSLGYFLRCNVSRFLQDRESKLCLTCATPQHQGTQTVGEVCCNCFAQLWRGGVMELQHSLSWRVVLLLPLMPCGLLAMSVRVLNEEPVHVIPGTALLLKAGMEHGPLEDITMVTWEREPEAGASPQRVTLATCPGRRSKCSGSRSNVQVSVEEQETTLQLMGYGAEDSGVYTVTITDQRGAEISAQCVVRTYEAVHHVSVSINISHSSLLCGEAWGTDPRFSWFYERVAVDDTVGRVSKDGATLYVTKMPFCGHFTCTVSNKLGYSSAAYTAAPCETEDRGTTAAVVCLILLLLLAGVLVFLLWRQHRHSRRGERLREDLDDTI
ncbi:uncharacterized protein si:dkeyp-97a10.2 isoform X2 [Takifugu flavidus]|uniref:uncharacterized protein si:dkeyp-97a10.2 isoform X2 n=1 Tax=Takifugu flavidus TaxID=433684 RepID=UPI0025446130|nr:uncharacterized protein si:dkeyp-97a10.2 isoform X2 [Takifugu flavidus]